MAVRNITKQLAGAEDLLLGNGVETQVRNGNTLTINKVDVPAIVDTVDDLASIDTTKYRIAIVREDGRGGTFNYDASAGADNSGTIFSKWVRQYNDAVNVQWFGTYNDGTTDDSPAINAAIAVATDIYIPEGQYSIKTTIDCNKALTITGAGSKPYNYSTGTILNCFDISPVTVSSTGVHLSGFSIYNVSVTKVNYGIGTSITGNAWAISLRDIIVRGAFYTAIDMSNTWNLSIDNVRVEGGAHDVGFEIDHGTSAILTSCLSYGAQVVGFKVHDMFYSSLISCGCDGGIRGIDLAGNSRGLSINNFGCESLNSTHINIAGGNSSITIDTPTLGSNNHLVDDDLIHIDGASGSELSVTFIGLKLPSAYEPTGTGKMFAIDTSTATPKITMINPVIYSAASESELLKCVILGGTNNNVVTSGYNSKGRWVKYYDGTLVCSYLTGVIASIPSDTKAITWTYPSTAFIDAPTVQSQWSSSNASDDMGYFTEAMHIDHSSPSTTECEHLLKSSSSTNRNYRISFTATGKWK